MKKGVPSDQLVELKKQAISKTDELSSLNYTFENIKNERKEYYQKIYKNQLGVEL
jgi:hypothetical protein